MIRLFVKEYAKKIMRREFFLSLKWDEAKMIDSAKKIIA
jgi:hypothetical protein